MPAHIFLLDTNTVSYLIKNKGCIRDRIKQVPMQSLAISCITEAELRRGLAKKPEATRLAQLVNEFLVRVERIAWDSKAASAYASLRSECDRAGRALSTMDMLIAAHAWALDATLITNDQAFFKLPIDLTVEDWSVAPHEYS